jgi:uncharacterized membrane protein
MEENRAQFTAVFGAFAALGLVTATIAYAVTTQVEGGVRSVFKTVAAIAVVLAVLTGYVAIAAWRRWWPLRGPAARRAGVDRDDTDFLRTEPDLPS